MEGFFFFFSIAYTRAGTFNGAAVGNPHQAEGSPAFVKLHVQSNENYIKWSWIDEDGLPAEVTTIEFLPGIDTRHGAMEAICCRYAASEGSRIDEHNRNVLQWLLRAYVKIFQEAEDEADLEAQRIREAFLQFQRPLSIPYLLEAELVGLHSKLVDMQNELIDMQNEIVDVQNEINAMQNEIVNMKNEIDAMHGFIAVVETSIRNGGYGTLRD